MTQKILRVFFSCVLSLFIALLCLAGGVCKFAQVTVCDTASMLRVAGEEGFTAQLYEEIEYDWDNLVSITGVTEPEEIMSVLTQEQVEQDALKYITDSYTGTATVDTSELRSQLDEKVRNYAYSHNINATPEAELEQNINDLVDACIIDYTDAIQIPLLPKILGFVGSLGERLGKLVPFIAAGAGVLILFLFFLQKKHRDILYYTAISSATAGIVLIGVNLLTEHYEILSRLPFSESAVKTLVTSYLQMILDELNKYSTFYLLIGALLLAVYLLVCLLVKLFSKASHPAIEQ